MMMYHSHQINNH